MSESLKDPNFLIIVADDLGFTDVGCFGGEIKTPNLDKLGFDGLRFSGFHTASACSPTRSMLFSGTDNHIAGLGQMAEFLKRFKDKQAFAKKPGYEGFLNWKVASLPEIIGNERYYNVISGKWHLGLDEENWPNSRGFEKTFTLLPGAGNHYKKNVHFKDFLPFLYAENGKKLDPAVEIPDDFYSTEYFTSKFLENLKDKEARKGRPFFGCLTYTAPHWPLQAPRETINKYKDVYADGPFELRKRRLEKSKELGIIDESTVAHLVETHKTKIWDELSEEEKKYDSRVMEAYAAMVDELDKNIGRVIDYLKETGEFENTLIVFMSDNGAEGMLMEAMPNGWAHAKKIIEENYDNSYENIGNGDSFVYYGDLWAQAATAPRYMYKMWSTEGGINCPLIFHYPKLHENWKGPKVVDQFCTVMDIVPTVLELLNIAHPAPNFKGREIYPPRGKSWIPLLTGKSENIYQDDEYVGWELFGQRALRQGRYKILYIPKPFGSGEWELYDIKTDPGETIKLNDVYPDILDELVSKFSKYSYETGLVYFEPYDEDTKVNRRIIKDD
ncbi:related to Arylsulfatase [Saccharomycodes ludwigii]|uniref:Related to Arylsulfatase n=1 Tax=Saccharomycodes ludwigii TaxID=36035 RepID=A0A376BAK4_9ASCO|nr:related to Arylsulfatase [Saccharomycodes ludwigii]